MGPLSFNVIIDATTGSPLSIASIKYFTFLNQYTSNNHCNLLYNH